MECSVCGERLRTIKKYGAEIDICPNCKGVGLDRGKRETNISQSVSRAGDSTSI
jgi:Zn-finger nucleic acid-binding protein